MKKLLALTLILMLALALAACGISINPKVPENNPTSNGAKGNAELPNEDDPCDCCPGCTQDNCEFACDKCECCKGGGLTPPPITYDIGIRTEWKNLEEACPFGGCGGLASGAAKVTMNWVDDMAGYFGVSPDGFGEYLQQDAHVEFSSGFKDQGHVAPGTTFEFIAQLSIPNPNPTNVIKVGFDFSGKDEVPIIWSNGEQTFAPAMMYSTHSMFSGTVRFMDIEFDTSDYFDPETYEFDHDTGMWILELPLTGRDMQKTFVWTPPGLALPVTITLTPA